MNANLKFTEKNALLAVINPASQGVGTASSGWVSVRDFHRICAALKSGVLGAAGTYDAKLQQATDSSGTGAKDITGAAITQIVKASGDNKQAFIECDVNALDANNGFAFVQLSITIGGAASLISGELYGLNPRYMPGSGSNPASVVQIVG